MILGDALVWLAVVLAVAAGAAAGRSRHATSLLMAVAAALTVAVGRLAMGFATEEWALDYVADHTRAGLAAPIRVAGLWAGAEGSLLLWTAMVAWAAVLAARSVGRTTQLRIGGLDGPVQPGVGGLAGRGGGGLEGTASQGGGGLEGTAQPGVAGGLDGSAGQRGGGLDGPAGHGGGGLEGTARRWAIRLGAGLVVGYGAVVALVASPFERSGVPAVEGLGLQPVLEYPAMIWHPPVLYAGLVGLLVPSIRAAAGMLAGEPGRIDSSPDHRPSTSLLVSMAVLTVGLATGALWAGVELGWGGYWAWDPIESAGLVAWLFGAAALHAKGAGGRTALTPPLLGGLLVAPGVAALWATTLTRVGLVASVHAFADRPSLRVGLLVVAAVASGFAVSAVVAASRGERRQNATTGDGRSGMADRTVAVAVLATAAGFVAIGAYEPLVEAGTTGDAVAIAGRYYTRVLWPVVIVGAALAVRADRRWWWAAGGAVIGALAVPLAAGPFAVLLAAAGGAVAASAVGCRLPSAPGRRSNRAGVVAHVGAGIALVGIAGTVATASTTTTVEAGTTEQIDGMAVTHRSVTIVDSGATTEAVAEVEIDGVTFRPRLVAYELRAVSTSETASHRSGLDEIQVQLVDGNDRAARYRIVRLPRVMLVWIGAALVAGGFAAQPLRRLRARSSDRVDGSSPESPLSAAGGAGAVDGVGRVDGADEADGADGAAGADGELADEAAGERGGAEGGDESVVGFEGTAD